MAIVTTVKDAEEKLNHPLNLAVLMKIVHKGAGSGIHDTDRQRHAIQTPEEVRILAAALARIDGESHKDIAAAMGISRANICEMNKGLSPRTKVNEEFIEKVDDLAEKIEEPIRTKALDRLKKAIDCISDDKLESANLKDINITAKTMASVFEKLGPKADGNGIIQFHIHAPKINKESDYKTIEVEGA